MLSQPEVRRTQGAWSFHWDEEQVTVTADRLIEEKDRLTSEITVRTSLPGYSGHLARQRINLLASRQAVVKTLEERLSQIDWYAVLEVVSFYVIEGHRAGEPVVWVGGLDDQPTRWALEPILRNEDPTILYGKGGQGKSHMATLAAYLMGSGMEWAGLRPEGKRTVLYLDYEASEEDINGRIGALKRGMGVDLTIPYRRCYQKLASDIEAIRTHVHETGAGAIIVDSLGMAVGGDLNDTTSIMPAFQAVRSLGIPVLFIHHENKESLLYGNVFIFNQARSVWQAQGAQDYDASTLTLGLYHKKSNNTRLFPTVGLRFVFGEDAEGLPTTRVERGDLMQFTETAEKLPLDRRITDVLGRGSMTVADIADEIGATTESVRITMKRKTNQFTRLPDGNYGLAGEDE